MITNNDGNLFTIDAILRRIPFIKPEPKDSGNYCDELSGNWDDVPAWAIRRINFLEETVESYEKSRCPKMYEDCPEQSAYDPDGRLSCSIIKHCYPYLCRGACGHNEVWVSEDEKAILASYRKGKYG
jgi:hypothetical protein